MASSLRPDFTANRSPIILTLAHLRTLQAAFNGRTQHSKAILPSLLMLAFPVLFCFLLVHIVLALTVEATKLGGELAMDTSFILFAKLFRFHILRCQEMGGGKGSDIPASEWRMQIQAAQGDAYS